MPEAATVTARKLVLVHGLFVNGYIMSSLARYFRKSGREVLVINYPTCRQTLAESAAQWLPQIQAFADGQKLDFIGHSLGLNANVLYLKRIGFGGLWLDEDMLPKGKSRKLNKEEIEILRKR